MTHIETLEAEIKDLRLKAESLNRESFELKVKIKSNEKRIKLAEDELEQLTKKDLLDVTKNA